jgi:hypothetical protein
MRISKWSDFQHYRHRKPAWIKLHRSLLDDGAYQRLPVASRALAPMLWLLASESEKPGDLPPLLDIAWRLRMSGPEFIEALKPLVSFGFVVDASEALADCEHIAIPEREKEREKEEEGEREKERDCVSVRVREAEVVSPEAAAEIDAIRSDHAAEEKRLTGNLIAIRDGGEDVQTVLDSVAEPRRKPFSAYGWLRNGRSGVPETSGGVTVLRLLNAALEARQRAQATPIISDSMAQTLESLKRSGDRIRAKMAAEGRKEIA